MKQALNNILALKDVLDQIREVPLFSIPEKKQQEFSQVLLDFFLPLHVKLVAEGASSSQAARSVSELVRILQSEPISEYLCAVRFLELIDQLRAYYPEDTGLRILTDTLLAIKKRTKEFALMEQQADRLRKRLTPEEVKEHDRDVIGKSMQLYALDYFLFMDQQLHSRSTEEQKRECIEQGIQGLPSLRDDALANDMLIKIVYHVLNPVIRARMLQAYVTYASVFHTRDVSVNIVESALRQYCRSLLEISLEYKIERIEMGVLFPYQKGTALTELLHLLPSYAA